MNKRVNLRLTDLDHLSRLKSLSWLTSAELAALVKAFGAMNFKRGEVIRREAALASEVNILLSGVARITWLNAHDDRVTIALLAPGLVPQFPSLPMNRSKFQCEAYNDCRVGTLGLNEFERIIENSPHSDKHLHENGLRQWYRLLLRGTNYLNLGLRERIATTLLELCADFGIEESRGTMLRERFSQRDIASLTGASRPRVTEHLAQLERETLVIRQGRQFIVQVAKLQKSIEMRAQ